MDSNETGPTLGSSFFFGRISAGHCDMDNMAFSPTSPGFSPFSIYVRNLSTPESSKPSNNPTGMSYENSERRFSSRRESAASNFSSRRESSASTLSSHSSKRKLSNLIPSAHQSFDNLSQLMLEHQTDNEFDAHVTQSLPATPLTTPGPSPQGSPKFDRSPRIKKLSVDEVRCSLPWFYSGFIAAHNPISEYASPLVCTSESQPSGTTATKAEVSSPALSNGMSSGSSLTSPSSSGFSNGSGKFSQKKYSFTNRDLNFLAPTSM